ncbi:MAG: ribosome-associated translation inhibitor RaiA [Muribaculaceae bacterium]|nr:ribosome-associated translation inhibitor RaiA [Muribaculaceae bacterium]
MEVRIQAIHFEISERLTAFINKKAQKLARHFENATVLDVNLKVVKPESAMNKEAVVKVIVPDKPDVVATKTADTFEEAVDVALDAVAKQLEKSKDA